MYFTAETTEFSSPFAITINSIEKSPESIPVPSVTDTAGMVIGGNNESKQNGSNNTYENKGKAPGFEIVSGIISILAVLAVLWHKRSKK